MGGDFGALTAAALGIALSPLPLLFQVALLGTSRPTRNAVAFVSGEAVAVVAIAGIALLAVSGDGGTSRFERRLSALELAIGLLFAVLLIVHVRRPRSTGERPGWAALLDRVGPRGAFTGGLAMIVANPKNLALTLAGAASIAQLGYSAGGQTAVVLGFAAVAVSALVVLVAFVAAFPERSSAVRARTQSFVFAHERVLVVTVLGGLAAFFVVRGVLGSR